MGCVDTKDLQLMELVFESSFTADSIGSNDGLITHTNRAFLDTWGYDSLDEVVGKPIPEFLVHEEEIQEILHALEAEGQWQGEYTARKKDGSTFIARSSANVVRDEYGNQVALYSSVMDVTAFKRTGDALRASEARYRGIFEWTLIAYEEHDLSEVKHAIDEILAEGVDDLADWFQQHPDRLQTAMARMRSLDFNPAAVKQYRARDKADLKDRFHQILLPESVPAIIGMLTAFSRGETSFQTETMVQTLEGTPLNAQVKFLLEPGYEDDWSRVLVSNIDITEINAAIVRQEQHAEELAREKALTESIMNSAPGIFYVIDAEGKFVRFNRNMETVTGFSAEELMERGPLGLFDEEEAARVAARIMEVFETGDSTVEASFLTRDGQKIPHFFTGSRILQDGQPLLIGLGVDISDRKEAEDRLREVNEELARSNKDLEQFAYVTSHDLQEPLRAVASCTQVLADRYKGKLGKDADDYIGFAVEGAQRMQQLIRDLLSYSRVNTRGKDPEPVDAGRVLDRVLTNLTSAIAEGGASVTHDEMPTVRADPTQLMQVLQNLVGNAIKFSGDGSSVIHVSAVRNGRFWQFMVRDNGIGIDPKYTERIFGVFQRLNKRRDYPGTGIGLAICKRIVERHGGRIWLESAVGEGTTFHFTIPA